MAVVITNAFAIEELPVQEEDQPLEIEPPLLIQSPTSNSASPKDKVDSNTSAEVDVARLEADLSRARKSAVAGDRLFKEGILAKVEAEERALKAIRLEARLADAQLQQAKNKLDELKSAISDDERIARELHAAETVVSDAIQNAARAADAKRAAEVEAAARNVERQRKLLALGSGRKADVSRAQEKLSELQQAAK